MMATNDADQRVVKKRTRNISDLTEEQIQQKRHVDRKAQRAFRQRTRDRISSLEQELTELKESSDQREAHFQNETKALREAKEMIRNQQLWVYYTADGELASIVGCTRVSETVAAITKVYTSESCRSKGCAERLVRRVCQ